MIGLCTGKAIFGARLVDGVIPAALTATEVSCVNFLNTCYSGLLLSAVKVPYGIVGIVSIICLGYSCVAGG